jgi:anti-sigma regulatory factor (Ser/Thr protein kinase)
VRPERVAAAGLDAKRGGVISKGTMKNVELLLPAAPTAPAEARAVVEAIGSDLPEPVLVDVKLLLTEVVTNAIKHASRGVQAVIIRIRTNHFIRVEVLDPGPMFNPDPRPPGTGAGSGRGLYLVDTVATAWGVEPDQAGKKVWFELRLAAG